MYSIESFFRFGRLILSAEYKFAKTMPKNLHWYTLRDTWKDDDFIFVVKFIREYGNVEAWGSRKYVYFRLNGFKYWTMGAPINKNGEPHTILINKAKIN